MEELGINKLCLGDRIALAEALFDSANRENAADTTSPEIRAELERRLELIGADPNRGTPWEKVREAARAKWQK